MNPVIAITTQLKTILILALLLYLYGCVSHVPNRSELQQNSAYFSHWHTSQYVHGVWHKGLTDTLGQTDKSELHIYIHGDGRPWLAAGKIARDPSPDFSLAWELFKQDNTPAIFISRPCYFGSQEHDSLCEPSLWTNARYSADIVKSLANAIVDNTESKKADRISLIGHSGGGTLATLVAAELNQNYAHNDIKLITIAANLDIDAWTNYHQYSSLTKSLNPAEIPIDLLTSINQTHYCGRRDRNIPIHVSSGFFERLNTDCTEIDAKHTEGWLVFGARVIADN